MIFPPSSQKIDRYPGFCQYFHHLLSLVLTNRPIYIDRTIHQGFDGIYRKLPPQLTESVQKRLFCRKSGILLQILIHQAIKFIHRCIAAKNQLHLFLSSGKQFFRPVIRGRKKNFVFSLFIRNDLGSFFWRSTDMRHKKHIGNLISKILSHIRHMIPVAAEQKIAAGVLFKGRVEPKGMIHQDIHHYRLMGIPQFN